MLKKFYTKIPKEKFPDVTIFHAEKNNNFCDTVIKIDWHGILYNRISFISCAVSKFKNCHYLEIGADHNHCFTSVPAIDKIGVDPEKGGNRRDTSDNFFKSNKKEFDVIFIDGLHVFDQCRRDVINSLKFLSADGFIFIHDLIPRNYMEENVPKLGEPWCGDVWKVAQELSKKKPGTILFFSVPVFSMGMILESCFELFETDCTFDALEYF